jgi:FkbM family methyltransferase
MIKRLLRSFGNIVNASLGPNNYEKLVMFWLHTKMKLNIAEDNIQFLTNIISEGDYCLDIGANRGEFTYYISRLVGDAGKVICFEPIFKTRERLKRTIKKFNLNNVLISPTALSDTPGESDMFIPKIAGVNRFALAHLYKSDNELNDGKICNGTFETVNVDTLDNVIGKFSPNKVSFIKCDVEGEEFEVLKGGEKTISRYKPIILVEIWTEKHIINNGEVFDELTNFLKLYGYTKKFLYEGKLRDFNLEVTNKEHIQDYFLIPECKIGDFETFL